MQRQKISTVASLLIAQLQAYKLKPSLAQVAACGVNGDGCPVLSQTSDNHPTIADVLPTNTAQNTTQSQPIYAFDIGAATPTVIQVQDQDGKKTYLVDDANHPVGVKVTKDETGEDVVLINDVKVEPIVINALAEQDTIVEIIKNQDETNPTDVIKVIENASSDTPTITQIDKPGQILVPLDPETIKVIPEEVTKVEPQYDDKGELEKICISEGGKKQCTNTEDLAIQHTAEEKIILDVTIPEVAEVVIKIVNGDSQGIKVYIDPRNPAEIVVDIGAYATSDIEVKIGKDKLIEQSKVQITDAKKNPSQVTIVPIPQEYGAISGAWQEYNNKIEVRTCQTNGTCSQWRADPCSAREQKTQVDVKVPEGTDPTIKVHSSDNTGTTVHVDPKKQDEVDVDVGKQDPHDVVVNVIVIPNIETTEVEIDHQVVIIVPDSEPDVIVGSWLEYDKNCNQRGCTGQRVNGGGSCGEWQVNPSCVPEPVVVDIKVPVNTPVIQIHTGDNIEPTVYIVDRDLSDPNSKPTVMVDANEGVIVKKTEDEKNDTINATVDGTPTSIIPIDGPNAILIKAEDPVSIRTIVVDNTDQNKPVYQELVDSKPVETSVDQDKQNPNEYIDTTIGTVINKEGDITKLIINDEIKPLVHYVPYVPPQPIVLVPNITDGKDITSTTIVIVVQATNSTKSAVFIVTDKQSDKNIVVVYTSDEKPTIKVLADQSGKIAAVAVNSNQIAPVVIGDLQFGPAVIINKSTQDAPQTYVISDTTTTNSKSDIKVIDPTTATIVTPENLIQLIEENIIDLFSIQADPKSPSGIMVCNENNDCKCGETYVSSEKAAGQDITPITPTIIVPSQTDQTDIYTADNEKGDPTIIIVTPNPTPDITVISQGTDKQPLVVIDGGVTTPTDLGPAQENPSIIITTDPQTDEPTTNVVKDQQIVGQVNTDTNEVEKPKEQSTIDANTVSVAIMVTTNYNGDVVVENVLTKETINPQTEEDKSKQPTPLIDVIEGVKAEVVCDEAKAKIAQQEKKIKELEEELAKFKEGQ